MLQGRLGGGGQVLAFNENGAVAQGFGGELIDGPGGGDRHQELLGSGVGGVSDADRGAGSQPTEGQANQQTTPHAQACGAKRRRQEPGKAHQPEYSLIRDNRNRRPDRSKRWTDGVEQTPCRWEIIDQGGRGTAGD